MKAAIYEKYGPPEVLQIRDVKKPTPRENEASVKIHATTVTRGDVRMRGFSVTAIEWLPARLVLGVFSPRRKILGMEFVGEIEAVGENVKKFEVGDKVFASTYPRLHLGAYAEYICLPENGMITHKPTNMSYEEATPLPSGGTAALVFLRDIGKIQSRDKVLINGASGTLGTYGVQIAKYYGAEVTGVCSSVNVDLVKSLGANHVIDYTKEGFTDIGERYDLVFDAIGNSSKSKCEKILTSNGEYIGTNGPEPDLKDLIFLKELVEARKLKTVIDRRYPLEEIIEAHRYVEKGHKKGNVIINVSRPACLDET
jgi:NADPH:quinone reductase-like Zn-dependent oxidoreductase